MELFLHENDIRTCSTANYPKNIQITEASGHQPGKKKICFLHELGNKMQLRVWTHCESLSSFGEEPWAKKTLVKFTMFNLKQV